MGEYATELREHLAEYKRTRLGVSEDGVWGTGPSYPHILPKTLERLNILETCRAEFWRALPTWDPTVKLHRDFHHLNSSQAMTFNLLFPLIESRTRGRRILAEVLGLVGQARNATFEKVIDVIEGTNFDFFFVQDSGARVFCELKLSESEFGTAVADDSHQEKLKMVYASKLLGKVSDACLKAEMFFSNYQVLRNICYLEAASSDCLYFIFPKANKRLRTIEGFLATHVHARLAAQVRVVHLEELAERIEVACRSEGSLLRAHYGFFREKYVIGEG